MLVEVGNKKVMVSWTHEVEYDREKLSEGADKELQKALALSVGRTVCTLEGVSEEAVVGVTYRSRMDSFDHVKGMKWSLKRALLAGVPRPERKAFWDAFLDLNMEGMKLVVHA